MGRSTSVSKSVVARKAIFVVLALAVALVGLLALSPAASAQTRVGGGECFFDPYGDKVCPDDEVRDPKTEVQADLLRRPSTPPDNPPSEGPLPFTGADVTLFLVTGGALVATGAVLVRRNRTRRSEI
jgi:LPXTG cell wall anchor motif